MRYALRKIATMLISLLAVSFLVFLAFNLIAGDAAISRLGIEATPERILALQEELELNQPLVKRYFSWLSSFVTGDMGMSFSYNMPVWQMIADKIPITLTLSLMAFAMTVIIAVPLGIYAVRKAGKNVSRIIMGLNQVVMAIPPFFLGLLLTLVFGLILKLFTPGGFVSYKADPAAFFAYLLLPALAIALPKAAMAAKLLRGSLLSEARRDYVRTAYGKGATTNRVLYHHVLKNAMIPLITFLGMALAEMTAGSIIIEQVFGIPGLGRMLLSSIGSRDYPVVLAIITLVTFMVLVINLLVDAVYALIDPRIRI